MSADAEPCFRITGQRRLVGELRVNGAKNAALPCLAAALLSDQPSRLRRVPDIEDVHRFLDILSALGVESEFTNNEVVVRPSGVCGGSPPRRSRSSAARIIPGHGTPARPNRPGDLRSPWRRRNRRAPPRRASRRIPGARSRCRVSRWAHGRQRPARSHGRHHRARLSQCPRHREPPPRRGPGPRTHPHRQRRHGARSGLPGRHAEQHGRCGSRVLETTPSRSTASNSSQEQTTN